MAAELPERLGRPAETVERLHALLEHCRAQAGAAQPAAAEAGARTHPKALHSEPHMGICCFLLSLWVGWGLRQAMCGRIWRLWVLLLCGGMQNDRFLLGAAYEIDGVTAGGLLKRVRHARRGGRARRGSAAVVAAAGGGGVRHRQPPPQVRIAFTSWSGAHTAPGWL